MGLKALVSVAGHDLPDPSVYNATTSTMVDSGRNAEGRMIGAVIRDSVAKVECTWKYLPVVKWAEILRLFNISLGGSFINSVTFYNQETADWETREMYVSDKTAWMYYRDWETGGVRGFTQCRIALVEV